MKLPMRPSERPPSASETLRDAEIADWIEARARCAVLFWDADDPVSQRYRARVEVVSASTAIPLGIVDVKADALVAQALGVKSVPTVVVFRDGDVAERLMGSPPDGILREALR